MSSKKKLIISLSVAAAVLVAAVIAIVAVFAAAQQTVTSAIKVTYTANANVVGTVSASYSFGSVEDHSMTTDGAAAGENNAVIKYGYDDPKATQSLQLQTTDLKDGSVEFNDSARYIVIKFSFTNEGSADYTATLTESSTTKENMRVEYSTDKADWKNAPTVVTVEGVDTIGASNSAVYYVRVIIDNVSFDADYEGTFSWNLVA